MNATVSRAAGETFIPQWELHDRLRKIRLTTGLDQKEFAERIGVTAASLAGWEAGRSKPRDVVAVARRIELLTRIPATWTLGLHTEIPRPDGPDRGIASTLPHLDSNQKPAGLLPRVSDLHVLRDDRRVVAVPVGRWQRRATRAAVIRITRRTAA